MPSHFSKVLKKKIETKNKSRTNSTTTNTSQPPSSQLLNESMVSNSVHTNVVDVSNISNDDFSHSLSLTNSNNHQYGNRKQTNRWKRKSLRNKGTISTHMDVSNNSGNKNANNNLDAKILEIEAKIQSQIQQLATDDNPIDGNNESNNGRLMSTSGVLLFDGLVDDVPDDESLQDCIRKERKQYTSHDKSIFLSSSSTSEWNISNEQTNFISAPKNYDPIKSGFIKRNKNGTYFYESDENSNGENEYDHTNKNSNDTAWRRKEKGLFGAKRMIINKRNVQHLSLVEQDSFEPSVEVVIDEKSTMWKL